MLFTLAPIFFCHFVVNSLQQEDRQSMKFIELFAGIGGFRLGLERQGHECVWSSEWLERPRGIYEYNFGEKPDERDITTVPSRDVPYADLIVGGFPCATFSVAGKRTGFSLADTRGTLCFEMFRIAGERSIPYIMFENVKGLLNHDSGRTFAVILSALDEMGYEGNMLFLNIQEKNLESSNQMESRH
jgi:DNA (cytosine-5)-methyltransferase 1